MTDVLMIAKLNPNANTDFLTLIADALEQATKFQLQYDQRDIASR